MYFFFVETSNTPLEEVAKHFDGKDALVGGPETSGEPSLVKEPSVHVAEKEE